MRRFVARLGMALTAFALLPAAVFAQAAITGRRPRLVGRRAAGGDRRSGQPGVD